MFKAFADWLIRRDHAMDKATDRLEQMTDRLDATIQRNERAAKRLEQVLYNDPLAQLLRDMERRASEGNGYDDDNQHDHPRR